MIIASFESLFCESTSQNLLFQFDGLFEWIFICYFNNLLYSLRLFVRHVQLLESNVFKLKCKVNKNLSDRSQSIAISKLDAYAFYCEGTK